MSNADAVQVVHGVEHISCDGGGVLLAEVVDSDDAVHHSAPSDAADGDRGSEGGGGGHFGNSVRQGMLEPAKGDDSVLGSKKQLV